MSEVIDLSKLPTKAELDELRRQVDKHTLKPSISWIPIRDLVDIGMSKETKERLVADGIDLTSAQMIRVCGVCGVYCSGH